MSIRAFTAKQRNQYGSYVLLVSASRPAGNRRRETGKERGYPVGDFEERAADLSVEHSDVLDHYRAAHRTASASDGRRTTEDMRQAMVHFRALFAALLGDDANDDAVRVTDVRDREAERRV